MKAFERHYQILMILNEKREVTVGYLAKEFNVSEKTIFRDVWFLSDFILIRTVQGRYGGGISYMDNYRYCNYKFYMTEEQERLLNKIINESKETGMCQLFSCEIIVLSSIIEKYSRIVVESRHSL